METNDQPKSCCLDCRHRRHMAGWYGSTAYLCVLTNRGIDSSTVLLESCARFISRRR